MSDVERVESELKGARTLGEFGASSAPRPLAERDTRRRFADPASGEVAFRAELPESWHATRLELDPAQAFGSWPFTLFFEAQDAEGSIIRYRTAHEWVQSPMGQMMTGQMGMSTPPNERPYEDPVRYLDSLAVAMVRGHEATMHSLGERDWPVRPEQRVSDEAATNMVRAMRSQAVEQMNQVSQAQGGMGTAVLDDVNVHSLCRVYSFDWSGADYRLALFTTLMAVKTSMQLPSQGGWQNAWQGGEPASQMSQRQGGFMQRMGNAAQEATRAFGADGALANAGRKLQDAMFGRHTEQGWAQQHSPFGGQQEQTGFGGGAQGGFGAGPQAGFGGGYGGQPMGGPSTVEWGDSYLFALIAPVERFDEVFSGAFTAFCSSASPDLSVGALKDRLNMERMQKQQEEMARLQQQMQQMQQQYQQYGQQQQGFGGQQQGFGGAQQQQGFGAQQQGFGGQQQQQGFGAQQQGFGQQQTYGMPDQQGFGQQPAQAQPFGQQQDSSAWSNLFG